MIIVTFEINKAYNARCGLDIDRDDKGKIIVTLTELYDEDIVIRGFEMIATKIYLAYLQDRHKPEDIYWIKHFPEKEGEGIFEEVKMIWKRERYFSPNQTFIE